MFYKSPFIDTLNLSQDSTVNFPGWENGGKGPFGWRAPGC